LQYLRTRNHVDVNGAGEMESEINWKLMRLFWAKQCKNHT